MKKGSPQNSDIDKAKAGQVEIVYYTDPLCCWSWAMEPHLRKIQYEYLGKINWRYCMGGLLPGWQSFNDELNSVSRPVQMGPVWMHAQQVSGMPMDPGIWIKDPPSSSYPACIAVKSVALQSEPASIIYLRRLREAVMMRSKNIFKQDVLVEVATVLSTEPSCRFNVERFKDDILNGAALEAFRKDINEVQYKNIRRFPTLIIKDNSNKGVVITGYRPYSALHDSLVHVSPNIVMSNPIIKNAEYKKFWGNLTSKEADEIKNHTALL